MTEIPEIIIPEIPTINNYIWTPLPVLSVPLPNIDLPGCVKTHRDASIKNTQIIEDDVNGAFYSCPEGKIPSFVPINYDRKKIQIVHKKKKNQLIHLMFQNLQHLIFLIFQKKKNL